VKRPNPANTFRCWRRSIGAPVILLIALSLASCGFFMDDQALFARAQKERQQGELRAASLDLKNALRKNPQNVEARVALGLVSIDLQDIDGAIRELQVARRAGVSDERVLLPLARAHVIKGQNEEALKVLAGSQLTPKRADLLGVQAVALLALGRYAEARDQFTAALQIEPNNFDALLGTAAASAELDGIPAALKLNQAAVATAPENSRGHFQEGQFQLRASNGVAAAAAFAEAASLAEKAKSRDQQRIAVAGQVEAELFQGHIPAALVLSEKLVALGPDYPVARYMRGRALFAAGKMEEARPLLEQNVAQDPNATDAKILLGAIALSSENFQQAEMYLSAVIAAEPQNPRARVLLAAARLRQRKTDDAINALLSAPEGTEPAPELLAAAGRLSVVSGKADSGVGYLERSVKAEPQNMQSRRDLAAAYVRAGKVDQARQELQSALAQSPGDAQSVLALSALELGQKHPDAAAAVLADAVKAKPDAIQTRALEVQFLLSQKNPALAEKRAREAVAAVTDKDAATELLARVLAAAGKFDEALNTIGEIAQKSPGRLSAQVLLGEVQLARKDYPAAADAFHRAAALQPAPAIALREFGARFAGKLPDPLAPLQALTAGHPQDANAHFALAQAQQQLNDAAGAMASYQRVIEISPKNAAALNNLAWLKYEAKDAAALDFARRAHEMAPADPRIIDTLGWILVESGQVKEGLALLEPIASGSNVDPAIRQHYTAALARQKS
jgi:tetratricopeptide (TPR) repeat protein